MTPVPLPAGVFRPTAAEQSMLGQLLEALRRPRRGGRDGRTRRGCMEDEGTERCVSQAERTSQFKSLKVPSGCDAWPCCRSRCSSGNSVAAMSKHSSKSSLLWYSSDTREVLSDWSVVSERAWQLDGVSGRWWSLVWSDSMSLSFCCSSLLSLQE